MADQRYLSVLPISIPADADLSDLAVRVAVAIGTFMDRTGHCSPGVAAIIDRCGRSERTVHRGIDELIARGHLTRNRRRRLSAELAWTQPVSRQNETQDMPTAGLSKQIKKGQNESQERPKSGALRYQERPAVGGSLLENCFNENKNEGEADRSHDPNSNGHDARRERPDVPQPIRESLTKWIGVPRDQLPPRT